jgi:hypothetical protein
MYHGSERSHVRSSSKHAREEWSEYGGRGIREVRAREQISRPRGILDPINKTYASAGGIHWVKSNKVSTDILTAHGVKWQFEKGVSSSSRRDGCNTENKIGP